MDLFNRGFQITSIRGYRSAVASTRERKGLLKPVKVAVIIKTNPGEDSSGLGFIPSLGDAEW
jgi:hypothetical protein